MNARSTSINVLCMGIVFTVMFVLAAALELAVAVQFQFRDQILDFGLQWPMSFKLPDAAINFAAYAGTALWLPMSYVGWSSISVKSSGSSVIAAMVAACLASVSIMDSVADLSVFPLMLGIAIWSNAALLLLIAVVAVGILVNDLEGYMIRYAKT